MTKKESAEIIINQNGSCEKPVDVPCFECFYRKNDNFVSCSGRGSKEMRKQDAIDYLASLPTLVEQPAPVENDNTHIADMVIADIMSRKQKGIETYGVPLQAHNGRDALQDAYEEALDLCCYLRQAMEEREK